MRTAAGKAPGPRKAGPGRGRAQLPTIPTPPRGRAHLDGGSLENRLDVLGDHVDVGLPLGWRVG